MTYQLSADRAVDLPTLTPSQRATAELGCPWTLEETKRGALWCLGQGAVREAILDAALVRLAMAVHEAAIVAARGLS